ncbi:hypothetical protein LRP31_07420 [Mesorhizobium mediterraneum]|uniref:Uncharacterized protein n=1 Tax=Mesorhizobium mediterraneum TaxID=43617 RepID=A0AB36R7N5_9HYPH|nr:hypothetical protein [Mesorhizobium mediterraneum]RUU27666.1 hypothetical protein EOD08_21925 [Mesorhizobium sp. M6A.T.Ca.TU.002.02.2.1]RWN40135.1 MAG: hypothetical protein EOR96_16740 [Mesorhizobium sp.]PAQ00758.1 hypothetical protein CIT25_17965 [Mesorhizobium mediterraneum]TIU16289.1 MAG: hypothetical protein E5W40_00095 [Mesorhizobium sp.]WIW55054.1 hypothetical protein LRP31_07420 [Mesorhizobium mediterraneum]
MLGFIIIGGILGILGFWLVPIALSVLVPYNKEVFGSSLFLLIAWIFVNAHHTFQGDRPAPGGNADLSVTDRSGFITMNGDNLNESGHDRGIGILLDRIDVLAGK